MLNTVAVLFLSESFMMSPRNEWDTLCQIKFQNKNTNVVGWVKHPICFVLTVN